MNLEIDVTGLVNYKQAWSYFQNNWDSFLEKLLRDLALEVMRRTIHKTPVDTGTLKGSWKLSQIVTEGGDLTIYIINDARSDGQGDSYASYVEFGHLTVNRTSWVEGVFMLKTSLAEVEEIANSIFNNLFYKYCKEAGL